MDATTQDMLHQRLNELIQDEEKIVTCLSVADELKVSANDAQHLLTTYVKDYGKIKPGLLHVTYLLSGSLKDNKGFAVYLVKDDDLQTRELLFDDISSKTVYSVQKSDQVDFAMIALTNKKCERVEGLITSKNCVVREGRKKVAVAQNQSSDKGNASCFKSFPSNTQKISPAEIQKTKKDELSRKQSKVLPKQNGGIKSFFGKSGNTQKPQPEEKIKVEKVENKVKAENGSDVKIKEEESLPDEKMDVDEKVDEKVSQKPESGSKKRKKSNKNTMPNKKRKRIQEIYDSESDDMFDDDDDNVIEKSDEEPPMQVTIKSTPPPKNKRRKAVDKTYMDEDGFIVTNTEYVFESVSDEEQEAKKDLVEPKVLVEKKKNKENAQMELKPSSKGKNNKKAVAGNQPTLMSFFKKT